MQIMFSHLHKAIVELDAEKGGSKADVSLDLVFSYSRSTQVAGKSTCSTQMTGLHEGVGM